MGGRVVGRQAMAESNKNNSLPYKSHDLYEPQDPVQVWENFSFLPSLPVEDNTYRAQS